MRKARRAKAIEPPVGWELCRACLGDGGWATDLDGGWQVCPVCLGHGLVKVRKRK